MQKIELPTTEIKMDGGSTKERTQEEIAKEKEDNNSEQRETSKENAEQKNGNGQEQKAAGV